MRILVFPAFMEIGGSQLNAVEIGAAVRDRGHEVTIFSADGPLVDHVHGLGLPHVRMPASPGPRPSPKVMAALCRVVRDRDIELVHGYEWPPALEAVYGPQALLGVPAVATVMSMAVAPFLPPKLTVIVGTRLIQEDTRARRPGRVELIEPPVDAVANAPGVADTAELAARLGVEAGDVVVAIVCRLVPALKLEGVLVAIEAVGELARTAPVKLVIAGDGPARGQVQAAADAVNSAAGRRVVVLAGQLVDPRPAYELADVTLGTGGSALRSMAFATPLVVQGERGFWELLTPETVDEFLWHGWHGVGDGSPSKDRLVALLRGLVESPDRRAELGAYGRRLLVDRFSLESAGAVQERIYAETLAAARGLTRRELVGPVGRSLVGVARHQARRRYQLARGTAPSEDFNALDVQPGARNGGATR